MKTHLKQIMLMLTLVFTFASCSSDNDNDSTPASKDVKYEVTGSYSGQLDVTYIEAGGGALNEDINSLPWTKEFTSTSSGVSISVSGYGGVKDETITVKIYVGGKVVRELSPKANNDGIIVAVPGAYVFGE